MEQVVKKARERIDRKESLEHQRAEHLLLKSQAEQMKSDIFFSSILTDSFLERPETAEMLCQYGLIPRRNIGLSAFVRKLLSDRKRPCLLIFVWPPP